MKEIITIVVILVVIIAYVITFKCGYKKGQIDCINKIERYELYTESDMSTRWRKKE